MVLRLLLSALLAGAYVYNLGGWGWLLGFVMWVPWLRALDIQPSLGRTLGSAYAMSVGFTAAAFAWFGFAVGSFTQVGSVAGLSVLLLLAPLFQPQFVTYALARHFATRAYGPTLGGLAAVAAWVATEWLIPKVLGDTLGYGLYPSAELRQSAALCGAAGLTAVVLLSNECLARALAFRTLAPLAAAQRLALGLTAPILLFGYGLSVLHGTKPPLSTSLRVGLVQSNLVDYERQRQERGAHAVVREVLDTHFAMSYDAVMRHHVDAVLWSETVYPTTFGHPKSAAGADLDQEILGIVQAAGVPFVFGTYDQDAAGEYNAAAFVAPRSGLVGMYRKTRLFPLTEYVPDWLDGPQLRHWLPWTGTWLPGNGARVFPLSLANGREIAVLPLICLDDVDTTLALQGARLGAQALMTLSNDAWFTQHPQGAKLHQAVAAFRSIETGLPQFRVTTNGFSSVIDTTGAVIAGAPLGERNLVIGELGVGGPSKTLMVQWGDWVGPVGAATLLILSLGAAWQRRPVGHKSPLLHATASRFPTTVYVLPHSARLAAALLRIVSRASLLVIGAAMLQNDSLQSNTLAQMRLFTIFFLAPELASWCIVWAFAANATLQKSTLVLTRGARQLSLAIRDIASVEPWRLPIPGPGVSLRWVDGQRRPIALMHGNPIGFAQTVAEAGGPPVKPPSYAFYRRYGEARLATPRGIFDRALVKFTALPTVLALAAFRLHQHIAYGSSFGEYYTFGLQAYLVSFSIWWAAWFMGVMLCAAALRAAIELGTLLTVVICPSSTVSARLTLERLGRIALYIGMPGWLLARALGG